MATLSRVVVGIALLAVPLGAAAWFQRPRVGAVETPVVLTRMREVARLETLEASVYRKVSYEPAPVPSTSLAGELVAWAKHSVAPRRGRAIVFATVHASVDLSRLEARDVRIVGDAIEVVVPSPELRIELQPDQTEVVSSNLDSAQTAAMLEQGRAQLEQQVRADEGLRRRAMAASERALRALLSTLGFREVRFVERTMGRS